MSNANKYATKEHRDQLIREIVALVKSRGRLTIADANTIFRVNRETMRRWFIEATNTGEVIRHDRCGLFRDEKSLAAYLKDRPRRLYGQQRAKAETKAKALECNGNDIFDECRQRWGGYHIHKIFGSARA